jgi:hypothetical protein
VSNWMINTSIGASVVAIAVSAFSLGVHVGKDSHCHVVANPFISEGTVSKTVYDDSIAWGTDTGLASHRIVWNHI